MTGRWLRAAVAVMAALASSEGAHGQTPTFSTRADAVEVDVLVSQRGRVVRGLEASDFELRDNGDVQQIDLVTFDQLPLSVLLALDVSDSLDADRRARLHRAVQLLLAQLTPRDEAGLVTFNERVTLGAPLTFDRAPVLAALDVVRGQGRTSLIDAAYSALVTAESGRGRSLLILFSDGVDSSSRLSGDAVLDVAGRSDVVVYAVSVGRRTGAPFLGDLATRTGGAVIEAAANADLAATFLQILEEFRQRYVLTYTPRGESDGGWRTLDVRVKRRGVSVRARPGYHSEP